MQGEELPYVFGVPLGAQGVYLENNFSPQEKLLSEVVMTLWTNFAKTGYNKYFSLHYFAQKSTRLTTRFKRLLTESIIHKVTYGYFLN